MLRDGNSPFQKFKGESQILFSSTAVSLVVSVLASTTLVEGTWSGGKMLEITCDTAPVWGHTAVLTCEWKNVPEMEGEFDDYHVSFFFTLLLLL